MKWLNRDFARRLLAWYDKNRRDLPWRVPLNSASDERPDPYHVLISETMLQQTQVATVIPYFTRFVEDFPTIRALARARDRQILRLWQGLGYYRRALNLRKAAIKIMNEHRCELPANFQELFALPGVGRYTAGAIASIAFGMRAPILDGNVARVLCRIDRIECDPREAATRAELWKRAEQILPRRRVGDFNSALMELGATICTPRNPACNRCPVQAFCKAQAAGVQDRIPAPRSVRPTPLLRRWAFCIHNGGRWLIERRPSTGRWPGMWQFVTTQANGSAPTARNVHAAASVRSDPPRKIGTIAHALTHRRYVFDVFVCASANGITDNSRPQRAWTRMSGLSRFPLPRPHQRIADMIRARENS